MDNNFPKLHLYIFSVRQEKPQTAQMEKGGWMSLQVSDIFSINSPQISAVRDSVLDSPEIHIGQNQLPTSLKSHTADTVDTLWSFQVPTRPEITSFA